MSGEAFASERLRNDPQLTFEDLRQVAEEAGVTIQPIQYGRARRQLGLTGSPPVPSRDAGQPINGPARNRPASSQQAVNPPAVSSPTESFAAAAPAPADADANTPAQAAPLSVPDDPTPAPDPATLSAGPISAAPSAEPKRKGSPAFDFLVESLRAEPTLSYRELQTRSVAKGYKIAPIMYGRAKALLGLVPVAPRGQGKNRKAAKLTTQQTLKQADAGSADQFSEQLSRVRSVDDLVQIIKHLDDERRKLRGLLENIANLIDDALDYSNDASA